MGRGVNGWIDDWMGQLSLSDFQKQQLPVKRFSPEHIIL
jgi:hypothetical protein